MILNYSFKSTCYPIGEHRTCRINFTEELTNGPAYDKLISVFAQEGIRTDCVHSLKYKFSKKEEWQDVGKDPLPLKNLRKNKMYIKIILKPCNGQMHEDLTNRIDVLEHENRVVKQKFDDLMQNFKVIQQQIEELRSAQQSPQNEYTPSLIKTSSTSFPSLNSAISIQKKDIDIAYVYAVPLVKKGKRGTKEPLVNPIDAHKEICSLEKLFMNSKKELQFTINTGNTTNIRRILEQKPKVLHISCHGGYELEEGKSKPYLYLEDNKELGIMQKFSEETIREIFNMIKADKELIRPRLIFLSACYSQKFGEIIMKEGVPNVIAVNGYTQVADEAATGFATSFYHFLLQGKSVKEAFESAKVEEKINNKKIKLCCCTHNHTDDCPWLDKLCKDRDAAHAMHIPSCDCNYGGNLHHSRCRWLKKIPLQYFNQIPADIADLVKVCCCSPMVPHNEEEKFMLLSQTPAAGDEKIFEFLPSGECTVTKCYIESLIPTTDEMICGRNIEVQELVEMLTCRPPKKIICVTGPPGIGKRLLIRTAAKYVMERMGTTQYEYQNFPDGFVSINLVNTLWLLTKLNSALLPAPNKEANSLEELSKEIAKQRKLVVLECENVMKNNAVLLVKKLKEVVKNSEIKFVLISNQRMSELNIDNEIILRENLDTLSTYNIIKGIYPEWKMLYIEFCEMKLAAKIKTPWLIKRVARLLKDSSEDDVYCRLCNEKVINKDESCRDEDANYENLIVNILSAVENKCDTLLPIYLLAQMHSGVFESTFTELLQASDSKLKENFDNYILENESIAMVTKTKVEDLGEFRYKVSEDVMNYIDINLTVQNRIPYIIMCMKKLAHVSRLLVNSYNFLHYKRVSYDEFTAILNEGVWASPESSIENTALIKDPIIRFNYEKDNIIALLDSGQLKEIASKTKPEDIGGLLDSVKELTLCTFTLLTYLGRPNEAMNVVDAIQGFAGVEDYTIYGEHLVMGAKYTELEATMMLLKQSVSLIHSKKAESDEGTKDTEKAEELFSTINNNAGIGEAQYLRGLILAKHKNYFNQAKQLYEAALVTFRKGKYKLGEARVSIAMAILLLDKETTEISLDLLGEAMNILKDYKYFNNMLGTCYYFRAKYYEETKNYEKAKEDLEKALEGFGQWNKCDANKCNVVLQRISELIQQDCPLFAFLKAFPLVKIQPEKEFLPLEPNVRQPSYFREPLNNCFNQAHKCIKIHFDTLTLENLKYALSRSCAVLHLSSDHYEEGYMSMEGKLGNLEQITLKELYKELEHTTSTSQCKVVVVAVPQGIDIAQMFLNLGIPHVVYFDFSEGNFKEHEDRIDIRSIIYDSMYKFCIEFYKNLLYKYTVISAWENAKYSTEEMLKCKGDALNIKYFHYGLDPGPVLLPEINEENMNLHSMSIFTNLKEGEFIDTSPKRAQCDIEKDRRSFVGRQVELHRIAFELCKNNYVNLYGDYGVGKTRLAKEVGYFLFVRLLFKSDICYIESLPKGKTFKSVLDSKLSYSQQDTDNSSILIIVDNMTRDMWQCERHYFMSLKNAKNYILLFISRDPLEPSNTGENEDFFMLQLGLKPFNKEISLDFIFAMLEPVKNFPKAASLGVEEHNRKVLRDTMAETKGFKQANGYPKLLLIFYEKILESNDIKSIDMIKDYSIGARYRKIMRHIDRETLPKLLLPSMIDASEKIRKESLCILDEADEFSQEKEIYEEVKKGVHRPTNSLPYINTKQANKNNSANEDGTPEDNKDNNSEEGFKNKVDDEIQNNNEEETFNERLNAEEMFYEKQSSSQPNKEKYTTEIAEDEEEEKKSFKENSKDEPSREERKNQSILVDEDNNKKEIEEEKIKLKTSKSKERILEQNFSSISESDESGEDSSLDLTKNASGMEPDRSRNSGNNEDREGEYILSMLRTDSRKSERSSKSSVRSPASSVQKKVISTKKKQQQNEKKQQRRRLYDDQEEIKTKNNPKPVQKKQISRSGRKIRRYKKSTNNKYYKYKEDTTESVEREEKKEEKQEGTENKVASEISSESELDSSN